MQISATIICKNAGEKITVALDSIAWCDRIVIVDSGSTDNTLALIRSHPAKTKITLLHNDWPGFNPQRQFAASQCPSDWVLMLDADEECSPALQKEIQSLSEAQLQHAALFEMPRQNFVAKRHVRCWGPDYQTRLIHKSRIQWDPRSLPEIRTPLAPYTIEKLDSPLLHNRLTPYQATDFSDPRQSLYAQDLAHHMQLRGKRATFLNLFFRPYFTFLKYYIFKGAFLQGRFGLVIAYKTTIGVMLKYSVLYGNELAENLPQKKKEETTL